MSQPHCAVVQRRGVVRGRIGLAIRAHLSHTARTRHAVRVNTRPADTHSAASSPAPSPAAEPAASAWFLRRVPFGVFLIIGSVIGLWMSLALSIDKLHKLENPGVTLACDLNPFFSCGSVMEYPQAQLLGFPNQFLGIAAFVVPLVFGVLVLARVELPGWMWTGLAAGLGAGALFCMYLFYTSIFAIGVGCPWCIVVWTVTIPMFCVVTGYAALRGFFGTAITDSPYARVFAQHALLIGVLWMCIVYGLIIVKFWTFFSGLL